MADLQSLMQMAQALQKPTDTMRMPRDGGGARPSGGGKNPFGTSGGERQPLLADAGAAVDPIQALQALLGGGGGGASAPAPGGNPMLAAIAAAQGGDPRARLAMNPLEQGGGMQGMGPNAGELAAGPFGGPGPRMATDSDILEMEDANSMGRTVPRPPQEVDEYASGEPGRIPDTRQTPYEADADEPYKPNIGAPGAPGQAVMGAYLNRNKGAKSTEEELDEVQRSMGNSQAPGPVEDGNFPPQTDIDALNSGKMTPQQFDGKWGKGAAQEMMDTGAEGTNDDDDGDHEYR